MTTILIAEDEPDLRLLECLTLTRGGFEVIEAGSGEEAVAHLTANAAIGLAVIDLRMPGIGGFGVLAALRDSGALGRLRVIVVSAHADADVQAAALSQGCAAYVRKPFRPAELLAVVRDVLARGDADTPPAGG
jgi:CheY-like chemotaxis protein